MLATQQGLKTYMTLRSTPKILIWKQTNKWRFGRWCSFSFQDVFSGSSRYFSGWSDWQDLAVWSMEFTAIHWPFSVFSSAREDHVTLFEVTERFFAPSPEEGNLGATFDCSSNFSCSPAVKQFWEMLEIWCKTLRFEGSGNRPPSFSLLDGVKKSVFFFRVLLDHFAQKLGIFNW